MDKIEGYKSYRHEKNPKEKELHDSFIKNHFDNNDVDFIVFGHSKSSSGSRPDDYLSDREKKIVISTIQWLGSPVGQGFLRENGFKLEGWE